MSTFVSVSEKLANASAAAVVIGIKRSFQTSQVSLGRACKSVKFSVPQFPHLIHEGASNDPDHMEAGGWEDGL